MSAVLTERAACQCGSIGRKDLWQCEHFRIFNGGTRLTSVGRIVGASFPIDPSIPKDTLENARDRGSEVDMLFAKWLRGELDAVPVDMRKDARDLFVKVTRWFNQQSFKSVEVQVLLGCEDYGGVVDFRFDGIPYDLKATYDVNQSAIMQVAGYADLCKSGGGYILHVTERYAQAKVVPLVQRDFDDWALLRDHWRMVKRRTKKELE